MGFSSGPSFPLVLRTKKVFLVLFSKFCYRVVTNVYNITYLTTAVVLNNLVE